MASQETVLLTGASGNLGAVALEHLLNNTTHFVNIVLRKDVYIAHFESKYAPFVSSDRLFFTIIPDLSIPGAFDEAAAKATKIMHIATPYADGDWVNSMIKPTWAIDKNIIEAAQKSKTVTRVVICGTLLQAIDPTQLLNPDAVLNEESWSSMTFEQAKEGPFQPAYVFSKTDAERKVWAWMEEHKNTVGFDVVMLLPPIITGRSPQRGYKPSGEGPGSTTQVINALFVTKEAEDMDKIFPIFADVDDIARTHILSLSPSIVPGNRRYLYASPEMLNLRAVAAQLRREYPELKERLADVPQDVRVWVKERMINIDTARSDAVFGVKWKGAYESVKEIVLDVVRWEKENGRMFT